MRPFSCVDVFTTEPWGGNPLAVVHQADGMAEAEMAAFARWTNLSETTFLLSPTDPAADYRVRIFTTEGELPFAGHPTLGSAHAWLEAGGVPRGEHVVQECGVGLVDVRRGERLAFTAPPLRRGGSLEPDRRALLAAGLGLPEGDVLDAAWVDNGPGWAALLLPDADTVLRVRPDWSLIGREKFGVVGTAAPGSDHAVEVRAFFDGAEDPVTGSLNAGLAQWLIGSGVLPPAYVARQGTALQRSGRVHVESEPESGPESGTGGSRIWVGGDCVTRISGSVGPGAS